MLYSLFCDHDFLLLFVPLFFPFEDVVGALLFIARRKSFTRKQKFGTSKDPIKNRTEKPKTVHNSRKKPSPMVVQLTKASFGSLPCQFFGTDHAQNWPFVWNLIIGEPKLASHCPYWFSHRQLAELRVAESFVKKKNGEPVNFHIQMKPASFPGHPC